MVLPRLRPRSKYSGGCRSAGLSPDNFGRHAAERRLLAVLGVPARPARVNSRTIRHLAASSPGSRCRDPRGSRSKFQELTEAVNVSAIRIAAGLDRPTPWRVARHSGDHRQITWNRDRRLSIRTVCRGRRQLCARRAARSERRPRASLSRPRIGPRRRPAGRGPGSRGGGRARPAQRGAFEGRRKSLPPGGAAREGKKGVAGHSPMGPRRRMRADARRDPRATRQGVTAVAGF